MRIVSLLLIGTLFSGCAAIEDFFSPCDKELAKEAYIAANASVFGTESLILRDHGTLEAAPADIDFWLNVEDQAIRLKTGGQDLRYQHPYQFSKDLDGASLARDYNPATGYIELLALLNEPALAPNDFEVYEIDCDVEGEFTLSVQTGKQAHVFTIESESPFRILYEKSIDEDAGTDLETTITYQKPLVEIPLQTSRLPVVLSASHSTSYGNGFQARGTFGDETQWAKFSELEVHIFDENGTLTESAPLTEGVWTMNDGKKFHFQDMDGNRMTTDGDQYSVDLDWGWDVQFYDLWAQAYTLKHQSAIVFG